MQFNKSDLYVKNNLSLSKIEFEQQIEYFRALHILKAEKNFYKNIIQCINSILEHQIQILNICSSKNNAKKYQKKQTIAVKISLKKMFEFF